MSETTDVADYCRQIETYLCRRNEGHLIRIVGPAFEQVCGWAEQGVPLKVAFRGIDRYCERYYAKGARRRPVRVEFCEADILELFDDWRRAVGVAAGGETVREHQPTTSLAAHLERVAGRLRALLTDGRPSAPFRERIDAARQEIEGFDAGALHARGERRAAVVARLEEIDRALTAAAVEHLDPAIAAALRRDAQAELSPFAARLPAGALTAATDAAFARLVREAVGLPTFSYE